MLAPDVTLTDDELRSLATSDLAVAGTDAVFRVEGVGALNCLQGLFTNDLLKPGLPSLHWGAFLTPKGMIITDAWVRRDDLGAWLIVPGQARGRVTELLKRTIPPRLARAVDTTNEVAVRRLFGRADRVPQGDAFARPSGPAPFTALVVSRDPATSDAVLSDAGWRFAPMALAEGVRVAAGWPALDREIDGKTIPQEARFDELHGVSYEKGCYTGQETVARVHFRGHVNRQLRGLEWREGPPLTSTVSRDGAPVGTIRTLLQAGDRIVALAVLRRELAVGDAVEAGNARATVAALPFEPGLLHRG